MLLSEQIKQGVIGTPVNDSDQFDIGEEDWFVLAGEEWFIGDDIMDINDLENVDQTKLYVIEYTDENDDVGYHGFLKTSPDNSWIWLDAANNKVVQLYQ